MNWDYQKGIEMSGLRTRKRALCRLPLTVIEHALRLQANQVLMHVTQDFNDVQDGCVQLLIEGDGLDDYFQTSGPVKEGTAKFYDEGETPELWIVPPLIPEEKPPET
tara:strand:- start:872 stop:1192 length:321 start_codon:yes stop_codon:yes gene_type:complete